MRFTPCACSDGHYRHLPRKWWMRVFFFTRQRYRCSSCKQTMLLPTRELTRYRRPVLLAIAMVAVIVSVTFAVGYWERSRDANWRAAVERQ